MLPNRLKLEAQLEQEYLGCYVCYTNLVGIQIYGRVHNLALEEIGGHPRVILHINNDRYEVDLEDLPTQIELL